MKMKKLKHNQTNLIMDNGEVDLIHLELIHSDLLVKDPEILRQRENSRNPKAVNGDSSSEVEEEEVDATEVAVTGKMSPSIGLISHLSM